MTQNHRQNKRKPDNNLHYRTVAGTLLFLFFLTATLLPVAAQSEQTMADNGVAALAVAVLPTKTIDFSGDSFRLILIREAIEKYFRDNSNFRLLSRQVVDHNYQLYLFNFPDVEMVANGMVDYINADILIESHVITPKTNSTHYILRLSIYSQRQKSLIFQMDQPIAEMINERLAEFTGDLLSENVDLQRLIQEHMAPPQDAQQTVSAQNLTDYPFGEQADEDNYSDAANEITIPATVTNAGLYQSDVDWYRFETIGNSQKITIATESGIDLKIEIYGPNDSGRLLAVDDDSGLEGNASVSIDPVSRGIYWVKVSGAHHSTHGSYRLLAFRQSNWEEPNDSLTNARPLPINSRLTDLTMYANDIDWFSLLSNRLPENAAVEVSINSDIPLQLSLFDNDENNKIRQLETEGSGYSAKLKFFFEGNDFFLKINPVYIDNIGGEYQLSYSVGAGSRQDITETAGEQNNDHISGAILLTGETDGLFSSRYDVDWYKLPLNGWNSQTIIIATISDNAAVMEFYNEFGDSIVPSNSSHISNNRHYELRRERVNGSYLYIKIRPIDDQLGGYTIKIL